MEVLKYNDKFKSKLAPVIKKYLDEVTAANMIFDIYVSMITDSRWNGLYNTSGFFFDEVKSSLLDSVLIRLSRLFEKKYRSKNNFFKFLGFLENEFSLHHYPLPSEINAFKNFIQYNGEAIERLLKRRDKTIAHLDNQSESRLLNNEQAELHMVDIERLTKVSLDFMRSFYYAGIYPDEIKYPSDSDDYINLFALIK